MNSSQRSEFMRNKVENVLNITAFYHQNQELCHLMDSPNYNRLKGDPSTIMKVYSLHTSFTTNFVLRKIR